MFLRKILRIAADILIGILILSLISIGFCVGIDNRYCKLLVVTSGSMSPTFNTGDLIAITKIDPNKIKVNDIITFQTEKGSILTHRIVNIKANGEIVTKGDANNAIDTWSDGWKLLKAEKKYIFRIPKLGYFVNWCQRIRG